MSVICEPLRQFWLPGLNEVTNSSGVGLSAWLTLRRFQVYKPIQRDRFVLTILPGRDHNTFCEAVASDINRFGIAAIESIEGMKGHPRLPKSTAWLSVRSYYAAFYAAHALIRVFEGSLTQFNSPQIAAIREVAAVFGNDSNDLAISGGLFRTRYRRNSHELECTRALPQGAGSHEAIWSILHSLLREMSTSLLIGNGIPTAVQGAATFLDDLANSLSSDHGAPGFRLLSSTRNQINYQHELGVWFPYASLTSTPSDLFQSASEWAKDPAKLNLVGGQQRQLNRFITACRAIVATYRVIATDMAERCPDGISFQKRGVLSLLSRLGK